MKASVFSYLDYRKLIHDLLKSLPKAGRGGRKNWAMALHCQNAFVTHVLKGEKDLSAEQALKTAKHFNFKTSETEYFLDLVAHNRAATRELREFFLNRLHVKREQFESLKNRLDEKTSLSLEDQARYYSHWLYAAVHMAITIPDLQNVESLANYFNVSTEEILAIVEFFASRGLAKMEMGRIEPGVTHVYVGADSPFVQHHHMIWRSKSMQDNSTVSTEDLQYSLCFTASKKDWQMIRENLVRAIEDSLTVIRPSEAEKLGMLCVDLRTL